MILWRQAEERLVGRLLFPASNFLLNRRGIQGYYRALMRTQHASADELHDMQLRRLRAVLEHAGDWVPYYKRLFRTIGFDPRGFRNLEELRHIPPLGRSELAEHRLELIDTRWHRAAKQADGSKRAPGEPVPFAGLWGAPLIRNTSSGSTGAPVTFYENGSITASNWANELRLRGWFGLPSGAREARMARISADFLKNNRNASFRRRFWNQLLLPGISLTEADYAFCAGELARFLPRVLWGFTSALTGLAEYFMQHPESAPETAPELTVTWAAPLHEPERKMLEEGFGCQATNVYGTRETGHIAACCEQRSLHVNQESLYIETAEAGRPAELLATTLTPTPMPFIRYRTGDLGILSSSHCGCGRTLEVIEELIGRTSEIHMTRDGRMISPNFWCRTFMDPKLDFAIRRFQVVYRSADRVMIRIVRGPAFTAEIESYLRSTVSKNLFSSASITFEYPERIEAQLSGKYRMVVTETEDTK